MNKKVAAYSTKILVTSSEVDKIS